MDRQSYLSNYENELVIKRQGYRVRGEGGGIEINRKKKR